jgi:type I restriction-modification system DNA methylase subunit
MKTTLEPEDIQAIAEKVIDMIRPLLLSKNKPSDSIMDKKGLSEYLKVDVSWIDKNLYALPHFKAGKYVRFKQGHIDKWVDSIEKTPSPYLKLMKNSR